MTNAAIQEHVRRQEANDALSEAIINKTVDLAGKELVKRKFRPSRNIQRLQAALDHAYYLGDIGRTSETWKEAVSEYIVLIATTVIEQATGFFRYHERQILKNKALFLALDHVATIPCEEDQLSAISRIEKVIKPRRGQENHWYNKMRKETFDTAKRAITEKAAQRRAAFEFATQSVPGRIKGTQKYFKPQP